MDDSLKIKHEYKTSNWLSFVYKIVQVYYFGQIKWNPFQNMIITKIKIINTIHKAPHVYIVVGSFVSNSFVNKYFYLRSNHGG